MSKLTESVVEEAALAWLKALGYPIVHGPEIAPGELVAELKDSSQTFLEGYQSETLPGASKFFASSVADGR